MPYRRNEDLPSQVRSHLPLHTLVDMTIEAGGQSADMHLDFTITGVNEPGKIPQPRA